MTDFSSIEKRFKWARVRRVALERSVNLYKKRHPLTFRRRIAEDRMSWAMEVAIDQPPPLIEWGLWHAGIVHDLRSMLDNSVWAIAHTNRTPSRPKKLEFPIAPEIDKWQNAKRAITELPDAYQACIENLQPFNRSQDDSIGVALRLVHALDVQNKHHAPTVVGVSKEHTIRHEREILYREQPDPSATTSVTMPGFQYQDGAVVWHEAVPKPIEKVKGDFRLEAHFVILDERGGRQPLLGSLDYIFKGCDEVFEALKGVGPNSNGS